MSQEPGRLTRAAEGHYEEGREKQRLTTGRGRLEFARTQELLRRFLPPSPAVVYDIGGGPGLYSFWLASLGYEVHLVDIVPLHIAQAQQTSVQSGISLASLSVGDARRLEIPDASADAVLLLGPLYHLTERGDRLLALREAYRILRPGGVVTAVGISRFASALDGILYGFLRDPDFVPIVQQDLMDGQHRNPANHPYYFTTAFFHHPDELQAEVREAGFATEPLFSIEGPGCLTPDFDRFWDDETARETLLQTIRALETEPSLLGVGSHLLAIGRKTR